MDVAVGDRPLCTIRSCLRLEHRELALHERIAVSSESPGANPHKRKKARSSRKIGSPHCFCRVLSGRMTIGIGHYLTVAACLFTLGMLGIFLNRKNVIVILMSIELMLLAVNINFVAFSYYLGDIVGQVFALFNLTVAAAEAAIGLAIVVVYYRNRGSIAVDDVNMMKG